MAMGSRTGNFGARWLRILMFGTIVAWLPPPAVACGYHDNVSLARGVLNWVYPDALHVVGAIAKAVGERRLSAPISAERGPWGYHTLVRSLDRHAKQLEQLTSERPPPAFSLLLIEPMLWTHFAADGQELRVQVHASGPRAGDLVLISGEEVIQAITRNRLTIGEAYRHGLTRLYGTEEQAALFLTLFDQVGGVRPDQ